MAKPLTRAEFKAMGAALCAVVNEQLTRRDQGEGFAYFANHVRMYGGRSCRNTGHLCTGCLDDWAKLQAPRRG